MKKQTTGFLSTENGCWKLTYEGKEYFFNCNENVPLDCIVLALEKLYPGLFIEPDITMSKNPWFGKHLMQYALDELAMEFRDIDLHGLAEEFATVEEKICTRCGGPAFYNSDIKNWQCTECMGHYSYGERPLRFVTKRPVKRNEYARKLEYFGPDKPLVKRRIIDV